MCLLASAVSLFGDHWGSKKEIGEGLSCVGCLRLQGCQSSFLGQSAYVGKGCGARGDAQVRAPFSDPSTRPAAGPSLRNSPKVGGPFCTDRQMGYHRDKTQGS